MQAAAQDIDDLWGEPAETVMPAVLAARSAPNKPLTWLQIGAIAGPGISLPSVALRSNNLMVLGSGQAPFRPKSFSPRPGAHRGTGRGNDHRRRTPGPPEDVEKARGVAYGPEKRTVFTPTAACALA